MQKNDKHNMINLYYNAAPRLKKNTKRLGLAASQVVKGFKLGGLSLGSMLIQ